MIANPDQFFRSIESHQDKDDESLYRFPSPHQMWDHIDIAMVRDRYGWVYPGAMPSGERIQLGAGKKEIVGWRNLEYPEWDAGAYIPSNGYVAKYHLNSDLEGNPYVNLEEIQPDESCAEVASYHTLDHLWPDQVINVLKEIQRVLKPGGMFTCIVPHYSSQLANECIQHRSRFAVDTWRNIFSERQYSNSVEGQEHEWKLQVMANFVYGMTERNLVLVTQMMKMS